MEIISQRKSTLKMATDHNLDSCQIIRQCKTSLLSVLALFVTIIFAFTHARQLCAEEGRSDHSSKKKRAKSFYLGVTVKSIIPISKATLTTSHSPSRSPAAISDRSLKIKERMKISRSKPAVDQVAEEKSKDPKFLESASITQGQELQRQNWLAKLFDSDEHQILEKAHDQVMEWEAKEEYAEKWNLQSTGMYNEIDRSHKINFITKQTLKYFDKKLSTETKQAEEGSTLKTVHRAQEVLKPSTELPISPYLKVRFKAHVLQGKATILLNNPYVDWTANINAHGNLNVHLAKDLTLLGIKTEMNYSGEDGKWEAAINKQISRGIAGQVSSVQETSDMAFSGESDKRIQLNFSRPFEF